jgi:RNA polymerase sigma-70 factor (sigma-E family)
MGATDESPPAGDRLAGSTSSGRGATRTGRRDDFTAFVSAEGTRLLRTAFFLTGDLAAAEDLLQDVLERTYVAWPRVEDPHAYVRTALSRRAINRWRLRAHRGEVALAAEHDTVTPDATAGLADRDAVASALKALPARQRATVVLRYFEELTERETAEALGCSVGTVKSQTSKAIATLRRTMGIGSSLTLSGPSAPEGEVRV